MARYRLFLFDEGLLLAAQSPSLGRGKKKRRGIKMETRMKVGEVFQRRAGFEESYFCGEGFLREEGVVWSQAEIRSAGIAG